MVRHAPSLKVTGDPGNVATVLKQAVYSTGYNELTGQILNAWQYEFYLNTKFNMPRGRRSLYTLS